MLADCLAVLKFLDVRFDSHLAQPPNLRSLFIALHDEVFEIRELALNIICRLAARNPAEVLPSLRTSLIHFVKDLGKIFAASSSLTESKNTAEIM